MRTLWGRMTSINVQKVAWVLSESGLAFDQVDAGGAFGGLDTDEYRAMNPAGRVPTLVEDELVLRESNAICRHLVHVNGGPLSVVSDADRAQADMWMDWFQTGLYPSFIQMFYQTVRLPIAKRDPRALASALDILHGQFQIAEAALADGPYLLGNTLTLADIPFGSCLYRYFTVDITRPEWPNISAYFDRLSDRQSYRDNVMIDYSSLRAPQ
ncbi:MAG: glutathione S-transferase family protein [Paracoccaceae bacterium]